MIQVPAPERTVGDALPTVNSPLWRGELQARERRDAFWRGFWWAAWLFAGLGAWAGWLAARGWGAP